jgi:rod shape determining protein RodA
MLPKRLNNLLIAIRGFDWWLMSAVFLLTIFGLLALYSLGLGQPNSNFLDFKKQVVFLAVGLAIMIYAGSADYVTYRLSSRVWYLLSLALLVGLFFFGSNVRGTRGWYVIANFSFQPVELMKVGVILILAALAAREARSFKTWGFFLRSLGLALIPAVLTAVQPDMGSALLLMSVWFVATLVAGVRKRYWLILMVALGALMVLAWSFFLKDYQKERFLTFLDPERDPLGRGYNITQSVIAVGSGQIMGRGVGFGSQSQLRFLPETQTDFIFAVLAEELGMVGILLVLGLYSLMFFRLLKIGFTARDDFALFVVLGMTGLFFFQFFVNVGMNIGLLPVTGITLPFMSAGGSSLLANYFLIGIAQSIARSKQVGR